MTHDNALALLPLQRGKHLILVEFHHLTELPFELNSLRRETRTRLAATFVSLNSQLQTLTSSHSQQSRLVGQANRVE
ncbi:MAG: hypothetical protein WBL39_21960 [Terrimicrobiaceae bacterium]